MYAGYISLTRRQPPTNFPRGGYWEIQICPGLNANEIQIPNDKHHKVSSFVKSYQNHMQASQTPDMSKQDNQI